jgi:four helix bundle protein
VWSKALQLSVRVHELSRTFPKDELYVLSAQIRRAADSIALNIAEGSTGQTNAEFKQFLGYALRSAIEVVGCLYLGKSRGLVPERQFQELYDEAEQLVKMLQAFRNRL